MYTGLENEPRRSSRTPRTGAGGTGRPPPPQPATTAAVRAASGRAEAASRRTPPRLRGDGLVVAHGEPGQEGLEALLHADLVVARVAAEPAFLDLHALADHRVDQVRVTVAEVGAHRVEARVHQGLEELPGVALGHAGRRLTLRAWPPATS